MRTSFTFRRVLAGLTVGILLALLLWPGSGWLVRSQFTATLPIPSSAAPWSVVEGEMLQTGVVRQEQVQDRLAETSLKEGFRRLRETAASIPNDYLLQYGAAVMIPSASGQLDSKTKVDRLRALASRFPDRPGPYAGALRYATQGEVLLHRAELDWFSPNPSNRNVASEQPDPLDLAAYDADAREGERLDPNNAFFPFMRSIGLFAAHRDAEALSEIEQASLKPNWNEYVSDDADGELKLFEQAFGQVGTLPRVGVAAAILFPQYAQLKSASRVAICVAGNDEEAGKVENGLAIREAIRRCGALLRSRGSTIICSLVGSSIEEISLLRPAGAPIANYAPTTDGEAKHDRKVRDDYDAYLRNTGHGDRVAAADAELGKVEAVRRIGQEGLGTSVFDNVDGTVMPWLAGLLLLSGTVWMVLLWGVGSAVANLPRIRTREGLPGWARASVVAGVVCGVAATVAAIAQNAITLSLPIFLAILVAGVILVYTTPSKVRALRQVAAFGTALGGVGVFLSGPVWHFTTTAWPVATDVVCQSGNFTFDAPPLDSATAFMVLAVPVLSVLFFGAVSLLWRTPLSVGLARGFHACGMPIACFLMLGYCAILPCTLQREAQLEHGLQRTLQQEGPFLAQQEGREWPSP